MPTTLTNITASFTLYSPGYFSGSTAPNEAQFANIDGAGFEGRMFLRPAGLVFVTMSNISQEFAVVYANRLREYYNHTTSSVTSSVISINYMNPVNTQWGLEMGVVSQSYIY